MGTREKIEDKLAKEFGMNKKDVHHALHQSFSFIRKTMETGDLKTIIWPFFGKFLVHPLDVIHYCRRYRKPLPDLNTVNKPKWWDDFRTIFNEVELPHLLQYHERKIQLTEYLNVTIPVKYRLELLEAYQKKPKPLQTKPTDEY